MIIRSEKITEKKPKVKRTPGEILTSILQFLDPSISPIALLALGFTMIGILVYLMYIFDKLLFG